MASRRPSRAPRAVIIHGLAHARAAAVAARELGVAVRLRSAPGAAGYAGAPWFREIVAIVRRDFPGVAIEASLDCTGQPGLALGALRQGIEMIRFPGASRVARKVAAIAQAHGAALDTDRRRALDLFGSDDPEAACRDWLKRK